MTRMLYFLILFLDDLFVLSFFFSPCISVWKTLLTYFPVYRFFPWLWTIDESVYWWAHKRHFHSCYTILCVWKGFIFYSSCRYTAELSRDTEISHISPTYTYAQLPPCATREVHLWHLVGLSWHIIVAQSTWLIWGFTLSIAHCMQIYNDMYPLLYPTEKFYSPKTTLPSACYRCLSQRTGHIDTFTISIVSPFPQCHRVVILHYVVFSDWYQIGSDYFVICIKGSPMSFYVLIVHFFLAPIFHGLDIPVYLWIYLLKDISVALSFWQFLMNIYM